MMQMMTILKKDFKDCFEKKNRVGESTLMYVFKVLTGITLKGNRALLHRIGYLIEIKWLDTFQI